MRKEVVEHFEGHTGGMAAVLSAYLIALATKLIDPVGWSLLAAYLSCISLVLLVLFKVFNFYQAEGDFDSPLRISILYAVGLTGSFAAYFCILSSINIMLSVAMLSTAIVAVIFLIGGFKKPNKPSNSDSQKAAGS